MQKVLLILSLFMMCNSIISAANEKKDATKNSELTRYDFSFSGMMMMIANDSEGNQIAPNHFTAHYDEASKTCLITFERYQSTFIYQTEAAFLDSINAVVNKYKMYKYEKRYEPDKELIATDMPSYSFDVTYKNGVSYDTLRIY